MWYTPTLNGLGTLSGGCKWNKTQQARIKKSNAECSTTVTKEYIVQKVAELYAAGKIPFRVDSVVTLGRMVAAVAWKESTFRTCVMNPCSTARGLMQVLEGTQRAIEKMVGQKSVPIEKIYEPDHAILLGATYLAYQYKRYGDWRKAAHAYMQGSYNAKKPSSDGNAYANAVIANVKKLFPV